jgi:hypothetical protein
LNFPGSLQGEACPDITRMNNNTQRRVLTGKPAFLTIADCEFKARRIQNAVQTHTAVFSPFATKGNTFRTRSDVASLEQRISALTVWN